MFFGGSLRLEILEEIFLKMLLTQEIIYHSKWIKTKSLTKIIDQNALEYLAFGENFIMDRLTGSTS